jgi:hypothetical protein
MKQICLTTLVILLVLSVLAVADIHDEEKHIRRRTRVVYDVHPSDEVTDEAPDYSRRIADLDGDYEDWKRVLDSTDMSMDCSSDSKSSKSSKSSKKYVMFWWSKTK